MVAKALQANATKNRANIDALGAKLSVAETTLHELQLKLSAEIQERKHQVRRLSVSELQLKANLRTKGAQLVRCVSGCGGCARHGGGRI